MKDPKIKYDIFSPEELDFEKIIEKYFFRLPIEDSVILIKLDLFSGLKSLQSGATANVNLVSDLIGALNKKFPKKIILAESGNKENVDFLFRETGFEELTNEHKNVELLDLGKQPLISFLGTEKNKFRNLEFSEKLLFVDYFIDFSSLKLNIAEKISGCWLNQFNFLPGADQKTQLQPFSASLTLDIFKLFKPDLCILDANIIIGSMGPVEGFPIKMGKIIVGDNPLVVDAIGSKLIRIDYLKIPAIKYAAKKMRSARKISRLMENIKSSDIAIQNISALHFRIFRTSFFISRLAYYINNLAYFLFLGGLALISIGGKDLVTGKWMSLNNYYKIAKEIITKVSKPDNLLNWKIAINKHVKEKTLS